MPAAWPWAEHVAMTRVDPKATCDAEMSRPAKSRFVTFAEYSDRNGMSYVPSVYRCWAPAVSA